MNNIIRSESKISVNNRNIAEPTAYIAPNEFNS